MVKYKFLAFVFIYIVAATSFASLLDVNVQAIYRVPLINIRWIDIAILTVIFIYLNKPLIAEREFLNNRVIINLSYIYLLYMVIELAKSWGLTDINTEISHFFCTLSIFIIIELSTFKIDKQEIVSFVKNFAYLSCFALIIKNFVVLYSFISGRIIFTDSDIRVAIEFTGEKESVYVEVIIALVYLFGLYTIQNKKTGWNTKKLVFLVAIISIYVSLVFSFGRGMVFMIAASTLIYILVFSKKIANAFIQIFSVLLILMVFYFAFGSALRQRGYDPIDRITQIVKFAADVNDPNWDKGRSLSRYYAIKAWKEHLWTGSGYDNLSNHGLPPDVATAHNFVITSLFHTGIIGTFLYLLILFYLFRNSIKIWKHLNKEDSESNDVMKLLIITSFFWLIVAWTQEAYWEKHSMCIEFLYLGLITNYYKQEIAQ